MVEGAKPRQTIDANPTSTEARTLLWSRIIILMVSQNWGGKKKNKEKKKNEIKRNRSGLKRKALDARAARVRPALWSAKRGGHRLTTPASALRLRRRQRVASEHFKSILINSLPNSAWLSSPLEAEGGRATRPSRRLRTGGRARCPGESGRQLRPGRYPPGSSSRGP